MSQLMYFDTTANAWLPVVVGAQGTTGAQGFGYAQLQGATGAQGVQGLTGSQGTQGLQGSTGLQGAIGTQGAQGTQGVQGNQGTTGSQGTQGVQGVIGDDGFVAQPTAPANTSLLWLKTDETAATLNLGTTSAAGVLQLTDSTSSTSTTTAATPNAVKTAYDLADSKLLKYATPWQTKYRSTYWYEAKNGSQIVTNTYTINRMVFTPVFIQENITLDRIGAECTSLVASSTYRLGIYNADSNGVPSTLVIDAGTIDTSSTGAKSITISQSLSAGLYYLVGCQQGGATNAIMRAYHNIIGNFAPIANTSMSTTLYNTSYAQDSVSGAFPSSTSSLSVGTLQPPRIQFRVA